MGATVSELGRQGMAPTVTRRHTSSEGDEKAKCSSSMQPLCSGLVGVCAANVDQGLTPG